MDHLLNNYKSVITIDCGSTMKDKNDKTIRNTCFFNSFKLGILQLHSHFDVFNYTDFLNVGGWKQSFKGRMVDSYVHSEHIEKLARFFACKIGVYTEILPGITNSVVYNIYGVEGPEISIIKIKDNLHFNLMVWKEDQDLIETDRILAKEIFEQMKIEEQIRVEKLTIERSKQKQSDLKIAIEMQASEDYTLAFEMQKIF
jgi:hypothetical protein